MMTNAEKLYKVRAVHCDYRADDVSVYEALKHATASLTRAWEKLRSARTIAIKFNQDFKRNRMPYFEGHPQQLVSEPVARAVIRLLREETDAKLFYADTSVFNREGKGPFDSSLLAPVMESFAVPYRSADLPPFKSYEVPGGGQMFRRYVLPEVVMRADALVSVQKMKNHAFMGVTLTLKNLFGLMPMLESGGGRARQYFHHLVRMPYMLADIGRLFNPVLNVVDALFGQAGGEWSHTGMEVPRIVNALVAGDHPVATDAVSTYLMGHNPQSDWLTEPFHRDRNALLVAAGGGFGTVDLSAIDWTSEVVSQPEGTFFAASTDSLERVVSWRRTTCEQALYYRDHVRDFVSRYAGQYILLQENEVKWHSESSYFRGSRRDLAGRRPDQAMWLKYVDPEEAEGEHFGVYEQALADIERRGLYA